LKKKKPNIIGVIPARWGSTRLPGKPLKMIGGKPMIMHVWERAIEAKLLDKVIVATDDIRIFNCVKYFGGEPVMTLKSHKSGTDRIGQIAEMYNYDIFVNIQGDEPFISPGNIDLAVKELINDKSLNVSTLCVKINDEKLINDPNAVKVVFDKNNYALYFSRSAIPYNRDGKKQIYYKHIGLYAYRRKYLMKLINIIPTKLELAEKLEQLRILESGEKIKVIITNKDSISVDTKEDLKRLSKLLTEVLTYETN
jgi:3-deoxy-manno-octulosonate cytidylyltransferase (CMP-KDO synthetase)